MSLVKENYKILFWLIIKSVEFVFFNTLVRIPLNVSSCLLYNSSKLFLVFITFQYESTKPEHDDEFVPHFPSQTVPPHLLEHLFCSVVDSPQTFK
jgi:hypothetical protein